MTGQEIFDRARVLLDEWTNKGVTIPDEKVADLKAKSILMIDKVQKELYSDGNFFSTFEITNYPAENLLGDNFAMYQFDGTTMYYPNESGIAGARAYSIEADGDGAGTASIVFQEKQSGVWTNLVTVSPTQTDDAVSVYKGVLSVVSTSNPVRVKVSGSNAFNYGNIALYSAPYAASKVPDYRPWIKVTLPSDFIEIDKVIKEFETANYKRDVDYKREGFKDIYISYYFKGNIRVVYKPVPTKITALTQTLDIDDITASIIDYKVAAILAVYENPEAVTYFQGLFDEERARLKKDTPIAEEETDDVYYLGGGY